MADFQPRFVDLVRNYTSTQGTGPFVLGPAVNGFTGFGSALQTGDTFYYSAIGVDKPAEREVGRGTLLANGTISRSPIGGTLTNFSSGTKSIALIAAAEWFNTVQAAGASTVVASARTALAASSSTQLPVLLTERGREGLFLFDGSNLSAAVAADPREGIYVAPTADTTGASGAWVRRYSGHVNVRWFGAKGDDVTDDGAAFTAAIAFLKSISTGGFGYGNASPRLFVPAGKYYLGTTTLDINHTLIIEGESVGEAGGGASVLRWAANTTGIRVQRLNTTGATGVLGTPNAYGGDSSVISRLSLKGAFTGTEAEAHGIHLRARATIRDVYISNFQGDGIYIAATTGAGAPNEGNANNFEVSRVFVEACRNGLFAKGTDANAGVITAFSAIGCRQWGVWDRSYLGNTYNGCHTATNGTYQVGGAVPYVLCYYSGRFYYVKQGQEAWASANAPSGTTADNTGWGYWMDSAGASSSAPAWTAGMNVRSGGPYGTDSLTASHAFTNCYAEMDQPPAQFSQGTLMMNGLMPSGRVGGAQVTSAFGSVKLNNLAIPETGLVQAQNSSFFFGPDSGIGAAVTEINCNTPTSTILRFRSFGGGFSSDGSILVVRGLGAFYDSAVKNTFRVGGTDVASVQSDGLHVTGVGAFSGALSASNFSGSSSGTNTGDQTITLTGDVTGSGTGSFATSIGTNKVVDSMIRQSAALSVIGRSTNSTGNIADIAGANNQVLRVSGSVLGFGAVDISTAQVTGRLAFANLTQGSARSVLGVTGNTTADVASIQGTADQVLVVNGAGSALAFGTVATGGITNSAVTYAKIQNVTAARLLGNPTGGAAAPSEISLAGGLSFSGTTLTAAGALTPTSVAATGAVKSSGAGGIGYATGAGGAVTQLTSKSTGVTLNKDSGQITMNNAALAAAGLVSFTVTNSEVAATDTINLNLASGNATAGTYRYWIDKVSAGSFVIAVENRSAGSLSEALVFNFAVVKGVNA